jgi:hypothetical protein
MYRTLARTALGVTALVGGLTFTMAGMAGATTNHTMNCTKAEARVPKIQARETKVSTRVTKAQSRESAATSAGHPKAAARIGHRITRAEKLEARGHKVLSRIAADCGSGSTPSS